MPKASDSEGKALSKSDRSRCIDWLFTYFYAFIYCSFETESYYVDQAIMKLAEILQPLSPKCWECKHAPPNPASEVFSNGSHVDGLEKSKSSDKEWTSLN